MNGVLIDSCVLLDIFTNDPVFSDWSENILDIYSQTNSLYINSIVYSEISIGFKKIETLEKILTAMNVKVLGIPREALFLAGKVFLQYKKNKGHRKSPLPGFYIASQATVMNLDLITRDKAMYKTYLPHLNLICPS